MSGLTIALVVVLCYALVAARLERWAVSGPIVFVAAGVVLGPGGLGLLQVLPDGEPAMLLTETVLALLLFSDASTVRLRALEDDAGLAARLLFLGLPLSIGLGTVLNHWLGSGGDWALAALVAVILAPTDAALSLPVVANPAVPVRIRRLLNVESGLNDGIAAPVVAFLIAAVAAEEHHSSGDWALSAVLAIAVAVAYAVLVGLGGGLLARLAVRRGLASHRSMQLAVLALALLSYTGSSALGGNGFVAAFTAGLVFGATTRGKLAEATEYTETTGLFLSYAVWVIFGAALLGPVLRIGLSLDLLAYALLFLTVVRMLPVAIALYGSGFRPVTVAFLGWFGPRGLASVVFLVMAVVDLRLSSFADPIVGAVTWTIALSVLLHGVTAGPLAARYGAVISATTPAPKELRTVAEPRLTRRGLHNPTR